MTKDGKADLMDILNCGDLPAEIGTHISELDGENKETYRKLLEIAECYWTIANLVAELIKED